jgi:TRAP-type C4-dicarboxylate transport system permease large subunit
MVELTSLHYMYYFIVLVVIVIMAFRKETVLPCIIGLFFIGAMQTKSIVKGVQVIYNALITSGNEFWGIILVISLVIAMSKALRDIGADELMMLPIKKLMISPTVAFFGLGFIMLFFSWFIWPSPAVALVGAIMLPAAVKAGLQPIWAAVAMNLFGHGIGLSSDFFIQGAPAITAKAAGISNPMVVSKAVLPLWITMSSVTILTSYIMMRRDNQLKQEKAVSSEENKDKPKPTVGVYLVAIITPLVFILDICVMYKFKLKGGDATALVGGTAVLIMCFVSLIQHKGSDCLEKITDYIREGFMFGIKIFAPVIVIGSFFFIGSEEMAQKILGPEANGLLSDLGIYLSEHIALSKFPVAVIQMVIGIVTGLDGSGFSGLPLAGALANTFSFAIDVNKEILAALGQLSTIWVGGGTIIPWGLIPVAAICNVNPLELAKKNFIPVTVGFAATFIVALFLL